MKAINKLLLSCVLLLIFSLNCNAETTATAKSYAGGNGSEPNPYKIATLAQLRLLSESPDSETFDKHFELIADIDASDTKNWNVGDHDEDSQTPDEPMGFKPIFDMTPTYSGNPQIHTGSFNGNGFSILNLYINRPKENAGFFRTTFISKVANLFLESCHIVGYRYVGGIVAEHWIDSSIENCLVSGYVEGEYTGGICGYQTRSSSVNSSTTNCIVVGEKIGGITGYLRGVIENCYTKGLNYLTTNEQFEYVRGSGGIAGSAEVGALKNSYSLQSQILSQKSNSHRVGGLIGKKATPSEPAIDLIASYFDTHTSPIRRVYGDLYYEFELIKSPEDYRKNSKEFLETDFTQFGWKYGNSSESPWQDRGANCRPFLFFEKTVVSNGAVAISDDCSQATLESGYVYNKSGKTIVEYGFVYSNDYNCTVDDGIKVGVQQTQLGKAQDVSFSATFNINKGTDYFYRAYAIDETGAVFYGDFGTFNANYSGGVGAKSDPYLLSSSDDLKLLSECPGDWHKVFSITNDIDMYETKTWNVGDHDLNPETANEAMGFQPIGNDKQTFTGELYGNGFIISNLYINRPKEDYVALFRAAHFCTINGVKLRNVDIKGSDSVAALCCASGDLQIVNCTSSGSVEGGSYVAGLVANYRGYGYPDFPFGSFLNCHSSCEVLAESSAAGLFSRIGEFSAHSADYPSVVTNCSATGDVKAKEAYGFAGEINQAEVKDCYATGDCTGSEEAIGFAYLANSVVENCYASGNCYSSDISASFSDNGNSIVKNCYASGAAYTSGKGSDYGAVGFAIHYSGIIENCYSSGSVTASAFDSAGFVTSMYSVGYDPEDYVNCFYDKETTGQINFHRLQKSDEDRGALTTNEFSQIPFIASEERPWIINEFVLRPFLDFQSVAVGNGVAKIDDTTVTIDDGYVYNNSDSPVIEYGIVYSEDADVDLESDTKIGVNTASLSKGDGAQITGSFDVVKHKDYYVRAYAVNSKGEVAYGNCLVIHAALFSGGLGTESVPYQINSAEDLRMLSESPEYWDRSFELTRDIDLSESNSWNVGDHDNNADTESQAMGFLPIGNSELPFKGMFFGNGFTVSNLYIHRLEQPWYGGLFGYVEDAKITNLNMQGVNIVTNGDTGAVVGYAEYSEVVECEASGSVVGDFAGGVVGAMLNSDIKNCYSAVSITSEDKSGGIVGWAVGSTIKDCHSTGVITSNHTAGGIAGYVAYSNVLNCKSECTVTANSNAGGISGGVADSSSYYNKRSSTIKNCVSNSDVSSESVAGGLVGVFEGVIMNSYSTGDVTADYLATGGIVGYSFENRNSIIKDCYTTASVSGEGRLGAIVGQIDEVLGDVTGCFFSGGLQAFSTEDYEDGDATDSYYKREVTQLSPAELKSFDFSSVWDMALERTTETIEDFAWMQDSSRDYPYLYFEGGYQSFINEISDKTIMANLEYTYQVQVVTDKPEEISYSLVGGKPAGSEVDPVTGLFSWTPSSNQVGIHRFIVQINDGISLDTTQFTLKVVNYNGSGSADSPFELSTGVHLVNLGEQENGLDKHFKMTKHIDLKGVSFEPIGTEEKPFNGSFDGGGFRISNLTIDTDKDYVGLFGFTQGATLSNIKIVNCDIYTPGLYAGGLVGSSEQTNYYNCSTEGIVSSGYTCGGLTGRLYNCQKVKNCFSNANVYTNKKETPYNYSAIGGLIGSSAFSHIYNCFSSGFSHKVCTYSAYDYSVTGGLIGDVYDSMINNSYSSGSLDSYSAHASGGVTGRFSDTVKFINLFSSVSPTLYSSAKPKEIVLEDGTGWLIGHGALGMVDDYYNGESVFKNCFWDREKGKSEYAYFDHDVVRDGLESYKHPEGTAPLNQLEMHSLSTFASTFSFSHTPSDEQPWTMQHGKTRPFFYWQKSYVETGTVTKGYDKNSFSVESSYILNNSSDKIIEVGYECNAEQFYPEKLRQRFTFGVQKGLQLAKAEGVVLPEVYDVYLSDEFTNVDYCYVRSYAKNESGEVIYGDSLFVQQIALTGSGTPSEPYKIGSKEDLVYLSRHDEIWDKHFVMTNDIDVKVKEVNRFNQPFLIGEPKQDYTGVEYILQPFSGVFNGRGYTISCGDSELPLFGGISGVVKNLIITDSVAQLANNVEKEGVVESCKLINSNKSLAELNYGTIKNSLFSGSIQTTSSDIGGITKVNEGLLLNCIAHGEVNGNNTVGGIVAENNGEIRNSYSTASVNGNRVVGGLVGENNGSIINSYSTGTVSGNDTVHGFLAQGEGCEGCYWDMDTSSYFEDYSYQSGRPRGLTTSQFANWNFTHYWDMTFESSFVLDDNYPWVHRTGDIYPRLYWEFNFSNFDLFEYSEQGFELLKRELQSLGIKNIIDDNLADYQAELFYNIDLIMDSSDMVQQIVNAVNNKDGFTYTTIELCKGWNLISPPVENWCIEDSDELKGCAPLFLFCFEDGDYKKCELSTPLELKRAYWLYVGNLEEDEVKEVLVKGPIPANGSLNLEIGWNMVGPSTDLNIGDAMSVFEWNALTQKYEKIDGQLESGKGYWIFVVEEFVNYGSGFWINMID